MADAAGRSSQKRRTRKALLDAATRLMREGRRPTLEEIAEDASVSRATAYRYFPNGDALLLEASLDVAVPEPADLFADSAQTDLTARIERVDAALDDMIVTHETALRTMLSQSVLRAADGAERNIPARQDRRTPLVRAAIAGAQADLTPAASDLLTKALAFLFGPEARVVARDVLELDDDEARRVRRWAIRALVDAAQNRSASSR